MIEYIKTTYEVFMIGRNFYKFEHYTYTYFIINLISGLKCKYNHITEL